jgi:hypothetical protein
MNPDRIQLFSRLAEDLFEASTAMDQVSRFPGGAAVVKQLHTTMKLPHDTVWGNLQKISWSEFKETRNGKWVLVKGDKGTGAIKSTGGSYSAIASTGTEIKEFSNDRGGNILDFLKGEIGAIRGLYSGETSQASIEKGRTRAKYKKDLDKPKVNQDSIILKFKPMWVKAATQALKDGEGFVVNQIKNGAYEKAGLKVNKLKNLSTIIDQLEHSADNDVPDIITRAVKNAITLTAGHYYPEKSGEIAKSRYGYGGSGGYEPGSQEGVKQLLQDLSSGDTSKLGTVLSFFKRSLIA